MATQKKSTGRDYPLSPTPAPMAADNTRVSKIIPSSKEEKYRGEPDYTYIHQDYTKKDSADYRQGYKMGIKQVSSNPEGKDVFGGKYVKGDWRIASLSNKSLNSGYNEGKDKVLDRIEERKKEKKAQKKK